MDHKLIIKNIKEKKFEKIYFLHGEEPYFIDEITNALVENVLEEHERDFNQTIVYGKDVDPIGLISELKNYPMMAARKLVVLKEAQDLKKMDLLESYFVNPSDTTIFVVNYKYKTYDARTVLMKNAAKNGLVYKSDKVKEYQMVDWVQNQVRSMGYGINSKACMLLVEFLGTDLSKMVGELNKLSILLEKGTNISEIHIEENIGISKDYNAFELVNALGEKNKLKAFQIVDYFDHNPKAAPLVMVLPQIFAFYSRLMRIHFMENKSKEAVAAALKVHPFVGSELLKQTRNYSTKQIAKNIEILHEYDLKSKGVGSTGSVSDGELMKEMVYRLLN